MHAPAHLASNTIDQLLADLDGQLPASIHGSWGAPVSLYLHGLDNQSSDIDRALLPCLTGRIAAFASWKPGAARSLKIQRHTQEKHPIAVVLLMAAMDPPPAPLALLIRVLCETALRPTASTERNRINQLSSVLRGALPEGGNSDLAVILGDISTLPDLAAVVEAYAHSGGRLHPTFLGLWKRWLRHRIRGWILDDPGSLRRALSPKILVPDLEASDLPLGIGHQAEPDDTLDVGACLTDPLDPGEPARTPRVDRARARATALVRASQGDLLAPADHRIPRELIQRVAHAAISQAQQLQKAGEFSESETFVALALVIATGLRQIDLTALRWGSVPGAYETVSTHEAILWRPVLRPPNAVRPQPELAPCLESVADVAPWPLPGTLYALLRGVALHAPVDGQPVLPRLTQAVAQPYRLYDVLKDLVPEAELGAGVFRLALGSHLAQSLGPDVAQLALADTFSMSAAPTYYSAPSQGDLIRAVSAIHEQWFGSPPAPAVPNPEATFGSRLVLIADAARQWPEALRRSRRSLAHRKETPEVEAWAAHRDFLAGSLCAATAHRPVDALGAIDLHQVMPEAGLIILRDKIVDPLRKVRIAATGARWAAELRAFLDRLVEIGNRDGEHASLARAILTGTAPLFSVPGPKGALPFTAARLRQSMPAQLQDVDNHYRHRLNQHLQRRGIDPELRFAQMGWVVSPAHATADLSPLSACDLARELGPVINDYLLGEGWFGTRQSAATWHWEGVPLDPWRDWETVARAHEEAHRLDVRSLRQGLHERGEEALAEVLPRLERAVREFLPGLRLDLAQRCLVRSEERARSKPIPITEDHCANLADQVRQGDPRPANAIQAVLTRIELSRLFKRSHRDGLTTGFIPRRPVLNLTAEPSPFLPGLGIAKRQVELLRVRLLARAEENLADDQGVLALLSVLLFSPYRRLDWAETAVNAAAKAVRGESPGDALRLPAVIDRNSVPMVFNGVPALLLARRGQAARKAHAPSAGHVTAWIGRHLAFDLAGTDAMDPLAALVATARAAGRIELSGPERLLMLGGVTLHATSVPRCLAAEDDWPVRTQQDPAPDDADTAVTLYEPIQEDASSTQQHSPSALEVDERYARLTQLLNPDRLPVAMGKKSDGHRAWRRNLNTKLVALLQEVGPASNLGLIVGFALHRLKYGGARVRHLAHKTLQTNVTRFAHRLLAIAGTRRLKGLGAFELQRIYLAVLEDTPPGVRPQALESLRAFQDYLETYHQVSVIAWSELSALAGPRIDSHDPGLLTDAEVTLIYETLETDRLEESLRPDASPDLYRLTELRIILFVVLEASGIRPGSSCGLVLGDLFLFGEGRDFLHVHRTGEYGSAKTAAAIGFVPLEGALWTRARAWVIAWLQNEQGRLSATTRWNAPLFADAPGSRRRYSNDLLQSRLTALVRWASNEPKALPYWLRKRRVMARHRAANAAPSGQARDVQAALCASGHAQIGTPLTSYISDPAIAYAHSLREGGATPRADVLAVTSLKPEPLDMAWYRAGPQGPARMAIALERLQHSPLPRPEQILTPPPPLRRKRGLLPMHIDAFARAMAAGDGVDQAILRAGLSPQQGEALQRVAIELLKARGEVPWAVRGLRHPRAVMKPPRALQGSKGLHAALAQSPSADLGWLADLWAATGYAHRLVPEMEAILLPEGTSHQRVMTLLTTLGIDPSLVDLSDREGGLALQIARPSAVKPARGDRRTLMASLHWLLAMVWLQQRITVP